MLIGSLFALAIAAALVVSITWLMRRTRHADHLLVWMLAGPVFAMSAALVLCSFDVPGARPSGFLAGELLGLIDGLGAGVKRAQRLSS